MLVTTFIFLSFIIVLTIKSTKKFIEGFSALKLEKSNIRKEVFLKWKMRIKCSRYKNTAFRFTKNFVYFIFIFVQIETRDALKSKTQYEEKYFTLKVSKQANKIFSFFSEKISVD